MPKVALLYDASQAVLSTFALDEVLQQILRIVRDYFKLAHSAVLLLEGNEFCLRSHSGWPTAVGDLRIPLGQGLVGHAAALKRPVYVPDVSKDPRYIATIPDTRCELDVPLMVQDKVVGVLNLQSHEENAFDAETIDLLTLFSTQASIALRNAHLYQLEQKRAAQLEAINAIARQTTAVTDLNALLQRFCSLLLGAYPADHVTVLLLEGGQLVLRAQCGRLSPVLCEGFVLPPGTGLSSRVLSSGHPVFCNDVRMTPDYVAAIDGARSEICLPLVSFGQPLGVLSLASVSAGAFEPADLGPLESMADICAAAIQNAIYFDQVRQLAYRDGLTGVFNRRFFEARMTEELERARRYRLEFSVLMIDLDDFKTLNDEFGHLHGDEALQSICRLFVEQCRKTDLICRFGGDEFAILLPETNHESAVGAAEKLRRVVAGFELPGVTRNVSVSVGIASYPQDGTTRDEIVKAADDALYRAKQAGRNCVIAATA